jgi:hypothetical protein
MEDVMTKQKQRERGVQMINGVATWVDLPLRRASIVKTILQKDKWNNPITPTDYDEHKKLLILIAESIKARRLENKKFVKKYLEKKLPEFEEIYLLNGIIALLGNKRTIERFNP